MRRLTISISVEFGKDEPADEWREGYSTAERAARDDPDERAELDHRRPIGFAKEHP